MVHGIIPTMTCVWSDQFSIRVIGSLMESTIVGKSDRNYLFNFVDISDMIDFFFVCTVSSCMNASVGWISAKMHWKYSIAGGFCNEYVSPCVVFLWNFSSPVSQ